MNQSVLPCLVALLSALVGCQSNTPTPSAAASSTSAVRSPAPLASSPRPSARPISDACKTEVAIVCPPGHVDGCRDGRTIDHACVALDAIPGPSCEAEIALICDKPGEINGCALKPPVSDHHICVYRKAR